MSVKTLAAALAASTLVVASAGAVAVSAKGPGGAAMAAKPSDQTIVDIVAGNDNFDLLKTAVIRAGLDGALSGTTQYTVFAPTDAAFLNLIKELDPNVSTESDAVEFINSQDPAFLSNILLFHVTEGRRISTSVLAAPQYQMLNGDTLSRSELIEAEIAKTDMSAKNGVIHVINSVLMP